MFNKIRRIINSFMNKEEYNDTRAPTVLTELSKWDSMLTSTPYYFSNASFENAITKTLNLPSFICTTLSNIIMLEFSSTIEGDEEISTIFDDFIKNNMDKALFSLLGIGSVCIKPFFNADNTLNLEIVKPTLFMPLRFDNNKLVDCVFISSYSDKYDTFKLEETHLFDSKGNIVTVSNKAYKNGTEIPLSNTKWANREPVSYFVSEKPLFVYIDTPIINIDDNYKNVGLPCYFKAIDNIINADMLYSSKIFEFKSGERKAFISASAILKDNEHKLINRHYVKSNLDEDKAFEDYTPTIRYGEYKNGLEDEIKSIENNCFVSRGCFSDYIVVAKTATEIKANERTTYNTVTKYQKKLEVAFYDLLDVLQSIKANITNQTQPKLDVIFDFYDSVSVDDDMALEMFLFSNGKYPAYRMLMKKGYSEKEAKQLVKEAEEEQPDDNISLIE